MPDVPSKASRHYSERPHNFGLRDDTEKHMIPEFFHGWRRNAGCVLLVLACAIAMWWAASYADVTLPEDYYPDLESHQGNIEYTVFADRRREVQWMLPYWSISFPLTLLSAYLILWPGKRPDQHI